MGKRNRKKDKTPSQPDPQHVSAAVPEASVVQPQLPKPKEASPTTPPSRTWPQFWANFRERALIEAFRLLVLSPLIMLCSPVVYIPLYRASLKDCTFTVDRRERVITGSGDSQRSYYLVWSREGEVFCVTDTWSFMAFDSSDRYGKLREGSQVQAKVAGWRVPFLSWYRNIVEIKSAETQPTQSQPTQN